MAGVYIYARNWRFKVAKRGGPSGMGRLPIRGVGVRGPAQRMLRWLHRRGRSRKVLRLGMSRSSASSGHTLLKPSVHFGHSNLCAGACCQQRPGRCPGIAYGMYYAGACVPGPAAAIILTRQAATQ